MLKRFNLNVDVGFSEGNIESKLCPGKFLTNCRIIAILVYIIESLLMADGKSPNRYLLYIKSLFYYFHLREIYNGILHLSIDSRTTPH